MNFDADIHPATGLRAGTFGIATLSDGQRAFPALVLPDGAVIDLSTECVDTHALFADWARQFDRLVDVAAQPHRATLVFDALRPLPPLAHPNLLMAGANYKAHVAQMLTKNKFNQHNRLPGESDEAFYQRNYEMTARRGAEGTPFFWTGLHSSMTGALDDIVLPVLGEQPDWELELGVVIGRHARFAGVAEAATLIAGYTIVNDLGSVDVFRRTDVPWGFDWVSKHAPSFKPIGPFIVPAAFIDASRPMQIQLRLNGETMQDWPTDDMVFRPEQILAYASERVNLMPGDILSTGSPPGNGMHHGRFLHDGDVIDSSITGLGRQRNHCRAEVPPERGLVYGHWRNAPT